MSSESSPGCRLFELAKPRFDRFLAIAAVAAERHGWNPPSPGLLVDPGLRYAEELGDLARGEESASWTAPASPEASCALLLIY
jgi:hypothetical protein